MHMKPASNRVLLELHVPDFELVKDYYEKLGFGVVQKQNPLARLVVLSERRKTTSYAFGLATMQFIGNLISSVFRGVQREAIVWKLFLGWLTLIPVAKR